MRRQPGWLTEELPSFSQVKSGQTGCFKIGADTIGGLDCLFDVLWQDGHQGKPQMNRLLQSLFELLIVQSKDRFERADHITDDIFRGIMQQGRQLPAPTLPAGQCFSELGGEYFFNDQGMLRDRKCVITNRLPVPAGNAGKAMGDIFYFNIFRRWIDQIKPPTGQHALPDTRWFKVAVGRVHWIDESRMALRC